MASRTFSLVHNIPSPYRLHLFGILSERLKRRGFAFRVLMMARQHRDRPHWKGTVEGVPFQAEFFRDYGVGTRSNEWHLNPGLIAELIRERPDYLMVGGPLESLTGAAASLLPLGKKRIAWFEGSTRSPGMDRASVRSFCRFFLQRYDYLAVPGRRGAGLAELIGGPDAAARTVLFPNIVDERCFMGGRDEASSRLRTDLLTEPSRQRLAIWVARLIPVKGILEFLDCLRPEDLEGWRLAIFGEGPLEARVRESIVRHGLEEKVILRSYLPYDQMAPLYRSADLMVLPSLQDLNPLSVIEAMHAGLPLLVSDRIGNHPEAIDEGKNGWTVDPTRPESVRKGIEAAFGASTEQLRQMGQRSRDLADTAWNSVRAIDRFLDSIGIRDTVQS